MACLYEENYYEEELIKIQDDIEETGKEPIEGIDKVSNEKQLKNWLKIWLKNQIRNQLK